ncbi:MAG: hypothetical protein ACI9UJ_000486 [bacterium]|jgi:hypothetical protein
MANKIFKPQSANVLKRQFTKPPQTIYTNMKKQTMIFALCFVLLAACENRNYDIDEESEAGVAMEYEMTEQEMIESAADYDPKGASSTYRGNNGEGWTSLKNSTVGAMSYAYDVSSNANASKENRLKRTNDKIIKKGSVGVQVKDYDKDKHFFEDIIRKYDGYKSNENEKREISRVSNTIEIRLPNQNFDKFIADITTGEGIMNVDYKRMSAVDVGEEYTDLSTRIKTKKEVEKRYIEILRKASKITDILAVEDQIRVIREEIESKEGRLRFLKDRISYSTINLYVYQQLEYDAPLVDKPTFIGKLANAAKTGWNMILTFLLFLVYIWPVVLLVAITIFSYKKKLFLFKNRK